VPKLSLLLVVLLVASVAQAAPQGSATTEIGSDFVVVKSKHRSSGEFIGAKKSNADDDEEEESTPPKRTKVRRTIDAEDQPVRRNLEGRSKRTRSAEEDEDHAPVVRVKKARRSAERRVSPTRRPMA